MLKFYLQLLASSLLLSPVDILSSHLTPIVVVYFNDCLKHHFFQSTRGRINDYTVKVYNLHVYIVLLNENIKFQYAVFMLVRKIDFFWKACFDIQFSIAKIEIVDVVADLHDRFLNYLFADDQFPKVYDILKFLDNIFEPHEFQVLIKLDILNHQSKSHSFAGFDHKMLDKVWYLVRLLLCEILQIYEGYLRKLGLIVCRYAFLP